jgi:L-threonylcarbamoyladenylate synthase
LNAVVQTAENSPEIDRALALLHAGELVAFPTETVYGLGADASNPQAVAKIFAAKGRPADHPLIVHLASAAALDRWARDIPEAARKLAAAFWPGPLTLILKRHSDVLDAVTGGQDSVGLRVPNHPLALALLCAFGGGNHAGIAAPSANRYGRISPTCAGHVRADLGERVSLVLDGGPCAVGIESTIVDLTAGAPRVLRPGAIGAAEIARVLGTATQEHAADPSASQVAPRVSGSLVAHYAPRTPLRLVSAAALRIALLAEEQAKRRCAVLARTVAAPDKISQRVIWQTAPGDVAGYAHDLYATLRNLDAAQCATILVEAPPATEEWLAVADRLHRAACGSGGIDET